MTRHNFFQQLFGKKDPVFRAVEEAIDLLEEQKYDEALDVLHAKALRRDPANKRALLHVGVAHMLKGELDEAERRLRPIAESAEKMDSDKAAAQIALERVAALRKEKEGT